MEPPVGPRTWEPGIGRDDPELEALIEKHAKENGALITLLQAVQAERGYLSEEALRLVSAHTGAPLSKLLGVATFYAQFRTHPVGKHVVRVCHGTACHVAGSALIEQALEDELGVHSGETTDDGLFTLNEVACLGCCSLAPAMMIETGVYGRLTPDKARRTIRRIRKTEAGAPADAGTRSDS